jgi:hypothetical protein
MGRISHTNLKNRMVIFEIATSKNHIELWSPVRSETGFVILSKFWSRYDGLQNFRKLYFLGDDQGELSKAQYPPIMQIPINLDLIMNA